MKKLWHFEIVKIGQNLHANMEGFHRAGQIFLFIKKHLYNILWFTQVDFLINVGSNFRYPVTLIVFIILAAMTYNQVHYFWVNHLADFTQNGHTKIPVG